MRTPSKFAVMIGLHVALAVQAGACLSRQSGVPCGDDLCKNGELCRLVETPISVQGACVPANECGNGIMEIGEQCDDGNSVNSDDCDNNCTIPYCGNGIVDVGEECDDGNSINSDSCDNNCTFPSCGNGIVDDGEECDGGNVVNDDDCEVDCTFRFCGNGIMDVGEQCDDGNFADGDDCESDCTTPFCGNYIVDVGEQCDDGNLINGDGCNDHCMIEVGIMEMSSQILMRHSTIAASSTVMSVIAAARSADMKTPSGRWRTMHESKRNER